MAMYRNVSMQFWTDAKVVNRYTPEDKYFYLYLLTNPHTNLCGCYEISTKQIASEMGYSIDSVDGLLQRFEQFHNVIRFDKSTDELLLINWHKHSWTKSGKFMAAVKREIDRIKSEKFRDFLENLIDSDTVSIPYGYGMDTTDTITITNTVSDTVIKDNNKKNKDNKDNKRKNRVVFKPPTVEDIEEYCRERGNTVDASYFFDYYSSRKWKKANGQPVRDWKQCIITWEHNDKKWGQDGNATGNARPFKERDEYDEFCREVLGVN